MKKTIIISAILLFTISAFAQGPERERRRQETQKQKSDVTRTRQVTPRETDRRSTKQVTKTTRKVNPEREIYRPNGDRSRKPATKATRTNYPVRDSQKPNNNRTRKPDNKATRTVTKSRDAYRPNDRKNYTPQNRHRVRNDHRQVHHYRPVKYNHIHYKYRTPKRANVVWTSGMYHDYRVMYPDFHYWNYPIGYRIITVPAYNAYFHFGEVRNIYGRVHDAWYSWSTDEYYLYFGNGYPYQDFTVIIPGKSARRFSRHPELFFQSRYIWVTGLVSNFEGRPEIIVQRRSQIHLY